MTEVIEHTMFNNVSVILPGDLVPSVSSDLPMTIRELCEVSDAMDCLITIRNQEMSTIENMEVWE
jgi:hypothetical protein